jgi:NAD+ kinase
MHPQRLGLIANTAKPGARDVLEALRRDFARHPQLRLEFEKQTAALIDLASPHTTADLAQTSDLLVVLGGDGTLLQALHDADGRMPPIFGINLGTLGFLTCVGASGHSEAVQSIVSGDFILSERTQLEVTLLRQGDVIFARRALNDAVVTRGEVSRLIRLCVRIDGGALTEYNADGLIMATPTGSTAYSLSAGGPVLAPDSGVFVITPICPHVLTNRSVIVSDASRIEIAPSPHQSPIFLTLDGRDAVRLEPGDTLCITKSEQRLRLAMPPGTTFFEVLRQKLKWSGAAV